MRRDVSSKLDRKVEVLKFSSATRDALNSPVETWTSQGQFSAQQMTQRAIEAWNGGGSAGQVEIVFRLRFCAVTAAIAPRDRLAADGRLFEVIGVPTEPRRRELLDVATISVPL